jgi:ATP-dependent helicase HrpA
MRLGGIDCAASYLHEPGDAKDGVTVTVPIYALNQVSEERCEWLVPGMLKDKVLALLQEPAPAPAQRLVPLPDYAAEFVRHALRRGRLLDACCSSTCANARSCRAAQRLQAGAAAAAPVHELPRGGRTWPPAGHGRNLASLKAELGGQARSAFQALAALKLAHAGARRRPAAHGGRRGAAPRPRPPRRARGRVVCRAPPPRRWPSAYTAWTFGELPELMEIRKGGQVLIGFPALIDRGTHVEIEVFDEPEWPRRKHRAGLRRLVALQIKEPLKYLEKNIPDLQKMAAAYMPLGTPEELREQIIDVALDRAFLAEPLPTDAAAFKSRMEKAAPG